MIKKLYPMGKPKAFNITYDDGVTQDVCFVQLLNSYGLKGTFNLNSRLMEQQFEWQHEKGLTVKRLPPEAVKTLYTGHEIASHSLTHPYMHHLSREEIMYQLRQDKENLQRLTGTEVTGFALPFSYYSQLIADCAYSCGFEYARCSDESYSYTPPENYYWWRCGAYHINPQWREFAEGFFTTRTELALLQIVGHSYDLDAEDMWDEMEQLIKRVAEDETVISMTNGELVRYLRAIRAAHISDTGIYNPSNIPLWFEIDGRVTKINPLEYIQL